MIWRPPTILTILDGIRRVDLDLLTKQPVILPCRLRFSVVGAAYGPGRLATGSLVMLAVLLAAASSQRSPRRQAKPQHGRLDSCTSLYDAVVPSSRSQSSSQPEIVMQH